MKKFLLLFSILLSDVISAQFFSGEIILRDKSIYYLNQIYVTNLSSQTTVYTDYFGTFKIPAKAGDVIRFTSIVTDRTDITVTPEQLASSTNFVELKIAYYDIQEVVINKFKPTGNLQKDVTSLKHIDRTLAIQKSIGLPQPKGDGSPPQLPIAGLTGGGLAFNLESIYDIISGARKKQERAMQYEKMINDVARIRQYFGDAYFVSLKIPINLIDSFLQFVYTSDNMSSYLANQNYEAVALYFDKYLPIYQRRLQNTSLMKEIK